MSTTLIAESGVASLGSISPRRISFTVTDTSIWAMSNTRLSLRTAPSTSEVATFECSIASPTIRPAPISFNARPRSRRQAVRGGIPGSGRRSMPEVGRSRFGRPQVPASLSITGPRSSRAEAEMPMLEIPKRSRRSRRSSEICSTVPQSAWGEPFASSALSPNPPARVS